MMHDEIQPGAIIRGHKIYNVNPEWPQSYVVWDLETTGLSAEKCHILEIGLIEVENGQVVNQYEWVLDHGIDIPQESIDIHGITPEVVAERGRNPQDCFNEFIDRLQPGTIPHITHNGYRFDIPWVVEHAKKLLGIEHSAALDLHHHLERTMIDTAVLMKGALLEMQRGFNEPMVDYAKRVMDIRAFGVKYNVTVCCEKLGIDMNDVETHRAGGDTLLTHRIYQHLVHPVFRAEELPADLKKETV